MNIIPAPGRRASLYYMRGDDKTYISRDLDLSDAPAVQKVVDQARLNYPSVALKLAVFQMSGNARKPVEILEVSQPALAGAETEEMTHVASRPATSNPAIPQGLDNMTSYILMTTQNQLVEKEGIILDLRDDKKRLETNERKLEDRIRELEYDLKGKDRDHEYAVRDAVAAQPKGLAGIGEVVSQFPPEVMTMLAARFFGPMPTPAAAAPQLGSHLSEPHRQTIHALTDWASESEANAKTLYSIVSAALSRPTGLEEINAFVQSSFS